MAEHRIYCLACKEFKSEATVVFKTAFRRHLSQNLPLGVCTACAEKSNKVQPQMYRLTV